MATDFGKRLRQAREQRGLSQEQLARRVGMAQSTLAAAESQGYGSRKTAQLASALGVDAGWLATGDGDAAGPRLGLHPETGGRKKPLLAQELTPSDYMIDPPVLTWEEIMRVPIPPRFRLLINDDSMADGPRSGLQPGHFAIFDSQRPAKPGDVVLLRDGRGNAFIRHYEMRRPGEWRAVALNAAYGVLDSVTDDLEIMAVQVGHVWA